MKRLIYIILAAVAIISATTACSSHKALSAQQRTEDSLANLLAKRLIDRHEFVLTASRITLGNSPVINVTDNTNFVYVNGQSGVIQLSPRLSGGPNGVGGITSSGFVTNYEVTTTKKGETVVNFRVTSSAGPAEVRVVLSNRDNTANAYVNATFNRGRATLFGTVHPLPGNAK